MKKIWDKLGFGFLQRFDRYLLTHYPVIWRTRGHWFILGGLVLAVILFLMGFFVPLALNDLSVTPIKPILIWTEGEYQLSLLLIFPILVYWLYLIQQNSLGNDNWKKITANIGVYSVGVFILMGITASAYKMGTIYRTAYYLMEQEHIDYLKGHDLFTYGYCLLPTDTVGYYPSSIGEYQKREILLNQYRIKEDSILENKRYDLLASDRSYVSGRSILSGRSYLSDQSYRSDRPDQSDRSYKLDQSYRSDRSYRSDLSYLSDQSYLPELSYLSEVLHLSYLSKLTIQCGYSNYYQQVRLADFNKNLIQIYQLQDSINFFVSEKDSIYSPIFIYQLEDAVRSVKHARQYLSERIFFRSLKSMLWHLFPFVFLMMLIPYLTLRQLLLAIFVVIGIGIGEMFFIESLPPDTEVSENKLLLFSSPFLVIPFLFMMNALLRKRRSAWSDFNFHLFFAWLMLSVLFILTKLSFITILFIGQPEIVVFIFPGILVLFSLLGCYITPYYQSLPRRS